MILITKNCLHVLYYSNEYKYEAVLCKKLEGINYVMYIEKYDENINDFVHL